MKKSLGQAKKRNKKVYITDIAIDHVPLVQYKGFDDEQNLIMQQLAKLVLFTSKNKNDSNEVAITCDLGMENPLGMMGVSYGTEHEVDVFADTLSNHLIVSSDSVTVVMLHNHPSTQTFSIQDVKFFLSYANLKLIVVVSNQGKVHYLKKENNFDKVKAVELLLECTENLHRNSKPMEFYMASTTFLTKCSEVGLYYW